MTGSPSGDDRRSIFQAMRLYGVVVAAGMEMVVLPLGGFLLDRWWGTLPWLTIVGFIVGIPIGMYHLYTGIRSAVSDRTERQK